MIEDEDSFDPMYMGFSSEGPEFIIDAETADRLEAEGKGFIVRARDMFQPGRVEQEGVHWATYWMRWYAERRN